MEDETILDWDKQWCNPQTPFQICAEAKKDGWVMPNRTVKIHMIGRHAGPPDYGVQQDYDKVWTLKPSIVTCGQPVKVTDEYGNPIPWAVVYAYQNGSIKEDISVGSDGRGSLTLNNGEIYRLKAFKSDYECYDCERTITACTGEVTLKLSKVPTKCTQSFKVVDYDTGAGIGGAHVNVAGVTLVTYADGRCSKPELTVGNSYTAEASKSGYTCDSVCRKTFTACVPEIVLKLKPPPITPPDPNFVDNVTGVADISILICDSLQIFVSTPGRPEIDIAREIRAKPDIANYGSSGDVAFRVWDTRKEKQLLWSEKYLAADGEWWVEQPFKLVDAGYVGGEEIDILFVTYYKQNGEWKQAHVLTGDFNIKAVSAVPGKCVQAFRVIDKDTLLGIPATTVYANGETCTTDDTGRCSIELDEAASYEIYAKAPGYLQSPTRTITACEKPEQWFSLEVAPERKDTKLTCYDKETAKGASVDLEAKLEVATFPYVDIEHGNVKFYIDDSEIGSDLTDGNGKAYVSYTPPIAGTFTIKAVFEAAGDYNASECTATLTVEECDNGVIVTVKDIPPEGLRVQCVNDVFLVGCDWGAATTKEATVITEKPIAVFSDLPWGKVCLRVITMDYDPWAKTGSILSVIEEIDVPSVGCKAMTMFGYLGRKYRTRIEVSPSRPKPGEPFELKAHLFIVPKTPAGPNMSIQFYEIVNETRTPLGAPRPTDDNGVAHLVQTKEEAGDYTYEAEYTGAATFAVPATVTVSEVVCPIDISALEECPIVKALQGTVVFTHLDTLRWYRDTKMSPLLVNAYYRLIPVTGRIARSSRTARLIVRAISTMSIRRIERKYGHLIPYLRCQQDVKH